MWRFLTISALGLLVGCQSMLPAQLRGNIDFLGTPTEAVVQWDIPKDQYVRWGGVIAQVKVRKQATWVEIVALPLDTSGRPRQTDESLGRFIARIPGLLDPMIYRRGREITVYGQLRDVLDGKIGEQGYRYPVLDVQGHRLWPKRRARPREIYIIPSYWGPYWPPYAWPARIHVFPKSKNGERTQDTNQSKN